MSGISVTVGSKILSAVSGTFVRGDISDQVYGNGIASAATIVDVPDSSTATMSLRAINSNSSATLTLCPKGSGTITCTKVSGQFRFTPGLIVNPQSETIKASVSVWGCTTSQGESVSQLPHAANYNHWLSATSALQLSCADFELGTRYSDTSVATPGSLSWNTPMSPPTSFMFSGFSITSPDGTPTITYPDTGGSGTATGSYQGSATASFSANPNFSFDDYAKCKTVAGLRVMEVHTGSVTFG